VKCLTRVRLPRALQSCIAIAITVPVQAALAQSLEFTTLYTFSGGADGKYPNSTLVQAPNGSFYGVTQFGGLNNDGGTVFSIAPNGVLTTIHSFTGGGVNEPVVGRGNHPFGTLILATDGKLYGTTLRGGAGACSNGGSELGCGTVFSITPNGSLSTIYAFAGALDGSAPSGTIEARDGDLYGSTLAGAGLQNLTPATAYRMTRAGNRTTIHSFPVGRGPALGARFIEAVDGNFYGTTALGGQFDKGTVFKLTPTGVYTVLHDFSDSELDVEDGALPFGSLVEGRDGFFYGVTNIGGSRATRAGTVFRVGASGNYAVLHRFTGGADGANPISGMIQGRDGSLYGTTNAGGTGDRAQCPAGCGTIFRISTGGTLETLHSFGPASGGPVPNGLIEGQDGAFYGTTSAGGSFANGTVFKVTVSAGPPPPPPPQPNPSGGGGGGGGATSILMLLGLLALDVARRAGGRSFRERGAHAWSTGI
jgi:uncharacterized repeat protein (TIGR03803 family)